MPDDPDDLIPPIGAKSYEGGNVGIYAYLADCTGKRVTSTVEVYPNRVGYDLPDEGPCIGYCHYNVSRPLERGDRVTASVTFDDSGETVTSPVLRVR